MCNFYVHLYSESIGHRETLKDFKLLEPKQEAREKMFFKIAPLFGSVELRGFLVADESGKVFYSKDCWPDGVRAMVGDTLNVNVTLWGLDNLPKGKQNTGNFWLDHQ